MSPLRVALVVAVLAFVFPAGALANGIDVPFSSTAMQQTWTVPAGVTSIDVTAVGAPGAVGRDDSTATGPAGRGAIVTGTFPVTEGQVLYVAVGSAGSNSTNTAAFNGGGAANQSGGGGGGATDLRTITSGAG